MTKDKADKWSRLIDDLMIFEKLTHLAPDELVPVVTNNLGWYPKSTYYVILDEVNDFFLSDLLERLASTHLEK